MTPEQEAECLHVDCAICDRDGHQCPGCGAPASHAEPVCAQCDPVYRLDETRAAKPPIADVASEPAPEAPAPELPKYRRIGPDRITITETLTDAARATMGDKIADLGRRLRQLERDDEVARTIAREEAKTRKEEIAGAAGAFDYALEAAVTGVLKRNIDCEARAVVATCMIETVRLDTGEVHASRAMTETEQAKWCRQGDITDATGGATVAVSPTGEIEPEEAPARPPAAPESDERWADAGPTGTYPGGWPVAWKGREWLVQIGDDPKALREADVLEVWLRLNEPETGEGQTVKDLSVPLTWIPRQSITHALQLLKDKALAKTSSRKWWRLVPTSAPAEAPEPGRADPLPEAGDITRPRLSEPETVADAMLASAGEVAAGYGIPS